MSRAASTLRIIRKIHLYFGVFISPAILFFAITGALQTFSLHETTRGSSYKPPSWIVKLGQLHKKQTLVVPVRKAPPAGIAKTPDAPSPRPASVAPEGSAPKQKSLLPMKIFFLVVSIGLVLSTFTGLYMAYSFTRSRAWISLWLVAGIAVPLLLLLL